MSSDKTPDELLLEQEIERLKHEIDRHVRIYEQALQETKAALMKIQEAFDAQPWATDEPVRIQLDRLTSELDRWRRGGVTEKHPDTVLLDFLEKNGFEVRRYLGEWYVVCGDTACEESIRAAIRYAIGKEAANA